MWLGHISEKGLSKLSKEGLLKNIKNLFMDFCKHCMYGKAHQVKFSKAVTKAEVY